MRMLGKRDTDFQLLPRVGHQIFVEAPEDWARAIIAAVDRHALPGSGAGSPGERARAGGANVDRLDGPPPAAGTAGGVQLLP